jgi:hypothetical protein
LFTPRYSWNIAKFGVKHQPINQSINQSTWCQLLARTWIFIGMSCCVPWIDVVCHYIAVLEMKIKIHWSESNSWIYLYIVLNKNCKNYWCKQSFTGLCPQDRCSSWGLILILVVDHLCSNFIFIIWYLCSNMNVLIMGINPVEKYKCIHQMIF